MNEHSTPPGPAKPFPAGARASIAAVVLVVDLLIVWIFGAHLGDLGSTMQRRTGVIVLVSAAIGAACLVVVMILNLRRTGAPRTVRPNRNTVASVVSVVAFLKLAAVVVTFLIVGFARDAGTLQMSIVCVVESLAVIWLLVGTTRHLASLTA